VKWRRGRALKRLREMILENQIKNEEITFEIFINEVK
jgi:delta-aminolevulinic acid dehydratase/porphobilinogen synthase